MTGLHGLTDEQWQREMKHGGFPGYLERLEKTKIAKKARRTALNREARLLGGLLLRLDRLAHFSYSVRSVYADSVHEAHWPDYWEVTVDGHPVTSEVSLADAVKQIDAELKKARE